MTTKLIVLACLLAVANARFVPNFNFSVSTLTSRIINGQDAKQGQFPHQISMQYKFPENGIIHFSHFCGGSILNDQWILTAAHCLAPMEIAHPRVVFAVKAGKHDLSSTEDTEQISIVDRFFIHDKYDRKPEFGVGPYDIGLVKLKNPLQLNKRVAPIDLPNKGSDPRGKAILSGWGAISSHEKDPDMPYILQTANLDIVDRATCMRAIRELHEQAGIPLPYDLVDETNICSGPLTAGVSACGGDSGGPLISMSSNGKAELIGIVSWGLNPCGMMGAPSVYARTSFFIDWVNGILAKN